MKMHHILFALLLIAPFAVAEEEKEGTKPEPAAEPNPIVTVKTSIGEFTAELFADEAPKTVENFLGLADGTKEWTDPKTKEKVRRPFYDGLVFHRVIRNFMIQGGCPLGNGMGGPGFSFADEIDAKGLGLHEMKAVENGQPHQWLAIRDQETWQGTVMQPLFRKLGIASQEDLEKRMEEVKAAVDALTIRDVYENLGYSYSEEGSSKAPVKGALAMANSGPNTNGSQFFVNLADTPWLSGKHTVFGKVVSGMDVVEKIGETKVSPESRPVEDVKIISIHRVEAEAEGEAEAEVEGKTPAKDAEPDAVEEGEK